MITNAAKYNAFDQAQFPWGGATINHSTGEFVPGNADAYAVTFGDTISLDVRDGFMLFSEAIDRVIRDYPGVPFVGIFHDAVKGTIDINAVYVFDTTAEVDAYAEKNGEIIGGAYHFLTGNGYWPQGTPEVYQ